MSSICESARNAKNIESVQKVLEDELGFDDLSAREQIEKFLEKHNSESEKEFCLKDVNTVTQWFTELFLDIHQFGYQLSDDQTLEDLQDHWMKVLTAEMYKNK